MNYKNQFQDTTKPKNGEKLKLFILLKLKKKNYQNAKDFDISNFSCWFDTFIQWMDKYITMFEAMYNGMEKTKSTICT